MELRQYLSVIWKWWWLAVLAVAIAAGSSYLASKQATPLYRTTTTLMIGRVIESPDPTSTELWTGQQLAGTYSQMAKREPVMRAALESLGLDGDEWRAFAGQVDAGAVPQTQFLNVTVVDTNPQRAKVLADAVAYQLVALSPASSGIDQEERVFAQQQVDDLKVKIEEAKDEAERLQVERDAAISARQIQDLDNQITVLQAKVSGWQNTYAQLLLSLQGGDVNTISVLEEATVPGAPFSPNVRQNVLLASAIGFVMAVGGAFLIEYLDDTIKTPDDVTRATELSTLGGIARIEGHKYPDKLVAVHHPLSPIVEAYRVLRTNLQFSSVDRPVRTLMVTSPAPTEGKSVTLANLAVVMAQSGLKVVVVDTDMRRPVLHKIFDLPNSHGVSDAILHSNPGAVEHLLETGVDNLWLLPSGHIPPNPSELLGSERMAAVVEELKEYADVVLFDAPPTLVVADAVILSSKVDGVLMVNDAGSTRRHAAGKAVEELRRVKANLLGVVLNRLSGRRNGYYYYYHYYYDQSEDGERKRRRQRHRRGGWLHNVLPFLGNGAKKPDDAQPDVVEEEIGTQINADKR
jgi:succinoglycan biosynthesis transport protein ExoP